jgi:branched-subunit amino acid transport protein
VNGLQALNGWGVWLTVLAAGIMTLAIRAAFIVLPPHLRLPSWAMEALRYVGAAVLPALVVPAVLFQDLAAGQTVNTLRLVAALMAGAVAIASRSVIATMVAGMVALWVLEWAAGAP